MGGFSVESTAVKAPVLPPAAFSRAIVIAETLAVITVLFALAVGEPARQAAWGEVQFMLVVSVQRPRHLHPCHSHQQQQ
jgi:hypothetical protein